MFFYMATPYSKHPRGTEAAFAEAMGAVAVCLQAEVLVFSPILHAHHLAKHAGMPLGYDAWRDLDEAMIEASAGIIVVMMDGWRESVGINAEIAHARALGLPVYYMEPEGPAPVVGGEG